MTVVYRGSACALLALLAQGACDHPPDGVIIELAPEVVSSIDGTTTARVLVLADRTPLADQEVAVTVEYSDRNGGSHAIEAPGGITDERGAYDVVLSGLAWEGTGTVTATAESASASATFAVLDRTPPQVEILPPTTDLHVGPGLPLEVQVRVRDEIGISEVWLEATGELDRLRSTVVASGDPEATVTFELDIPDGAAPGPTITLYAMAGDLSNNLAAAEPVTLIVDPAVAIATPAPLDGDLLAEGTGGFLSDPRGLAVSPRDGALYVADNAGNAPCNGACVRRVDPATGAVDPAPVAVGVGTMEGVAFDASGDNLFFTDRQRRVGRLSWDAGNNRYVTAGFCNDIAVDNPADPYHLISDAALGLLIVDADRQRVARQATCLASAQPVGLTGQVFDEPRGIAAAADGTLYVSDFARDAVYAVDRTNGAITRFESVDEPWGVEWVGGSSPFAGSLLVASRGDARVLSTTGALRRTVAFLRNDPIDVAMGGGTAYILTVPSAGDSGRIFRVTGF